MNTLMNYLHELKLDGLRKTVVLMRDSGDVELSSSITLLNRLFAAETEHRHEVKTQSLAKRAQFRYGASLASVITGIERNLDKSTVLRLAGGQWIKQGQNLLITGPTGAGKSYLASAAGRQACQLGLTTLYFNCAKLWSRLRQSRSRDLY